MSLGLVVKVEKGSVTLVGHGINGAYPTLNLKLKNHLEWIKHR